VNHDSYKNLKVSVTTKAMFTSIALG